MASIELNYPVTRESFREEEYLSTHPDVVAAINQGLFTSGREHFERFGFEEARWNRRSVTALRQEKLKRIDPFLKHLPHRRSTQYFDFLMSDAGGDADAAALSAPYADYPYSVDMEQLIFQQADGIVLDVSAGRKPIYYDNVLTYGQTEHDTTDILGPVDALPFKDEIFDAVITVALLDHAPNPSRCAAELVRVLKAGGQLICCIPFPERLREKVTGHQTMTPDVLRDLFEGSLEIVRVEQISDPKSARWSSSAPPLMLFGYKPRTFANSWRRKGASQSQTLKDATAVLPLHGLMVRFASLGDNCEFGFVQRRAGAEPISLLRFASFPAGPESSLRRLIGALRDRFVRLAERGSVRIDVDGPHREFVVREQAYGIMYHTGRHEGELDAETVLTNEYTRLTFLRRHLMDDLESAAKTWIWKSNAGSPESDVRDLLATLRELGPNRLLWVVQQTAEHTAGTVELLSPGFARGYVQRFAPYDDATDISPESWFAVCRVAHDLLGT